MKGIKVLDFTRLLPGPLATYVMAHLGADVIKVEDTEGGDITRYSPPILESGEGALFSLLNIGKKSLAVNLKKDKGKEIIYKLVENTDVLIEGFRPGVMEKLGLDYERLNKINPRIIYCSISGYGQTGPYRTKSGHDINYISLSGIEKLFISEKKGICVIPGVQIADISGALFAVIAVQSKLIEREISKDFSGAYIDISMTETSIFFGIESLGKFLVSGKEPEPFGEILTGGVVCYNIYKTRDGKWVSIGALEPKFWQNLVSALGLDLIPSDAMTEASEENPSYRKLKDKIAELTSEQIEEIFRKNDIPYEFVRTYEDMINHPQIKERGIFYKVGNITAFRLPFMIEVDKPAPKLGEHTSKILKEIGYEDEEIRKLKDDGVVFF